MNLCYLTSLVAATAFFAPITFGEPAAIDTLIALPTAVFDFQASDRSLEKKGSEVGILLKGTPKYSPGSAV